MTIQQVANELGVSTKTLRRWEASGYLMPDERQEVTGVRLYHPDHINYWKNYLELRRLLNFKVKELEGIKKALDEHPAEQVYVPGKPLRLLTEEDLEKFQKARDAENKWNKEFDRIIHEIAKYPRNIRKAVAESEEGKT